MNIVYVRMQDFDKRFYVSSEREICRAFFKAGHRVKLIGIGHRKDEPEFVELFSEFGKNTTFIKLLLSFKLIKEVLKKTVIVFDNN